MIDEQARQIEQACHPGDDGDDVEGLDVGKEHRNCQGDGLGGAGLYQTD